jgi:hypothetical protein
MFRGNFTGQKMAGQRAWDELLAGWDDPAVRQD